MKVNILLPFPPHKPGGGPKVLYEYANHLNRNGHEVIIYHSLTCPYLKVKQPYLVRYLYFKIFTPPRWFKLDPEIKIKVINSVNNKQIADGDILLYTWWALSYDVEKLGPSKGEIFNLIQGTELWTGHEEKVKASYFLPRINNIVISEHIREFILSSGKVPISKVPVTVSNDKFQIYKPISDRNPFSICMMYSMEPHKGSSYGLEAIRRLKEKYPQLEINLFSVFPKSKEIDFEVNFYQKPNDLEQIMNRSAIFITPSLLEGCALPPMEAMHCGCALVCTDIGGHSEYAIDKETALLFKCRDVEDLVAKVVYLLEHDDERQQLATRGNQFIRKNTWESSTQELLAIFHSVLSLKNKKLD